jgi:hypothetical protein
MFIILAIVITGALTDPAAHVYRVSSVHHRPLCTLATCDEIPHPDHDYLEGHLWVDTITGGPNELSPVLQVSFTTPQLTPLRELEFVPNFTRGGRVQTRALGQTRRSPSKMRGR